MPTLDETDVNEAVKSAFSAKSDPDDADEELIKQWAQDENKAFHYVKMGIIYCVPSFGLICILIYFWHVMGYPGWRWLTATELQDMRSVSVSILSGVFSSLAVSYFYRNK
jgi:hypothetical protein